MAHCLLMFIEQGRKGFNSVFYYALTLFISISGFGSLYTYLSDNFKFDLKDSNQVLVLSLIPFVAVLFFIIFNTTLLHKRSIASLFNTLNYFRWRRFFIGFGIWVVLLIIGDLICSFALQGDYQWTLKSDKFWTLVFVSVSLLPIQTLAEEVFFRSYILQGLSNLFSKSIFPIILSSVIFMGAHMMNPETEKYGMLLMCVYYFLSAFFLAVIIGLDNGIEQSYGIHTATNLYGTLIVSYEGAALQTDALWTIKNLSGIVMVITSVIAMIIYYFIVQKFLNINQFKSLFEEYKKEEIEHES